MTHGEHRTGEAIYDCDTAASPGAPLAWSAAGVSRSVAADQSGVPEGFQRTVFEAAADGSATLFLRLRCTLVQP